MSESRKRTTARVIVVLGAMGVVALGLLVQLVRVQFGPYAPVFASRAEASLSRVERVVPSRGMIYDREGRLLASNATMYHVEIEVRQLTERSRQDIAAVLSKLMLVPFEDLYLQLSRDWIALGQFRIRLTREDQDLGTWPLIVDQTVADVINGFLADPTAPDLSGLSLVAAPQRVYPAGDLAGHVLGFVNSEGKGYFGIEGYYDEWLSGKPITIERPLIPPEARLQPDPPAGVNLVLTVDAEIQQMVESALKEAIEASEAESGEAVIMDPQTGEILAMAAFPALDPNDYEPWLDELGLADERIANPSLLEPTASATPTEAAVPGNGGGSGPTSAEEDGDGDDEQEDDPLQDAVISPAASAQFEPGSTFKVLTMSAALDMGAVQPDDVYIDTGEIEVGGNLIRNWDGEAWGPQTMTGCLQHSLNVCLAWVASEKIGASDFYEYLERFGMGQLTGIDVSGEVSGQLRTPRHFRWTASDLGTNSFGQGVSVSPIQLMTAVGAIANGGVMMQPHLVRQVVGPQGVYWPKPTVIGHPISAETADQMTEMLAESLDGETSLASVDGYRLAGKTGTAQIPTDFGYDPTLTIASFIGWGPIQDPSFMVFVRIDEPRTSPWGSVIAAPVFKEIVERLVVFLEIPPDSVRANLAEIEG